jgi:hypothetical protein
MSKGLHAARLGFKKTGSAVVEYITNLISITTTFDPPSLATMTNTISSGITVTGALTGDMVEVYPPYDLQGLIATAYVTAADTVKISIFNPTGGTVDLASGAWMLKVLRGA